MNRIILRNREHATVAEFPQPDHWRPAPDIIVGPVGQLYLRFGKQEGVISYCAATSCYLPDEVEIKELVKGP